MSVLVCSGCDVSGKHTEMEIKKLLNTINNLNLHLMTSRGNFDEKLMSEHFIINITITSAHTEE